MLRPAGFATMLMIFLCVQSQDTYAQWPSNPVRLIVPFGPGGPSDAIARRVAQGLSAPLGVSVIVENRPGAGGNIGLDAAVKSAPDGNVILLATNTSFVSFASTRQREVPGDVLNVFEPLQLLATSPYVLAVPSAGAKDFATIVQSRERPDTHIGFSSAIARLAIPRLFGRVSSVPFKSAGAVVAALAEGQIAAGVTPLHSAMPQDKAGRIRILAVLANTRSLLAPQIPTIAEVKGPGILVQEWYGLFAIRGTPSSVVARLRTELEKIAREPGFQSQLEQMGLEPRLMTASNFVNLIQNDLGTLMRFHRYGGTGGGGDVPCPSGQCWCQRTDQCQSGDCKDCAYTPFYAPSR